MLRFPTILMLLTLVLILTACIELSRPTEETPGPTEPNVPARQLKPKKEIEGNNTPAHEDSPSEPVIDIEVIPKRQLGPIDPDYPSEPVTEVDMTIEEQARTQDPELAGPTSSGPPLESFGSCENRYGNFHQILVKLRSHDFLVASGMSPAQADEVRENSVARFTRFPITQINHLRPLEIFVFQIPVSENQFDIASALIQTGDYDYVRKDCAERPVATPNDTLFINQTYHTTIGSEAAWDLATGSPSVTIAILDTGVESTHPDLSAQLVNGYNAVDCSSTAAPGCGNTEPIAAVCGAHGTQVAGIAGATGNNGAGVAGMGWNFSLMPIRISNNAVACTASVSDMSEAIIWASENGADIINLSYSGAYHPTLQDAAALARQNGSLVVMASGNDGLDLYTICVGAFGASVCDHALQNDILIVGSVNGADTISAFSNTGAIVDMVAPGETIRTTTVSGTYTDAAGTSFAAPMVAGAAALLLSANPALSPRELSQILISTAQDLGSSGEDDTYGSGRLELDAAMLEALDDDTMLDLADNRKLDFQIPKGPFKILRSDQPSLSSAQSRLFILTSANQGLVSFNYSDISTRDLNLSELPSGLTVGAGSLFYRKDDFSDDFVMTDTSRRYIFYGTTSPSGTGSNEPPVIRSLSCGPFNQISAIHLTEASGVTQRLVVADQAANTVYSYVLDTDGPTLCTSEASASVTAPVFIKSLSGAPPTLYIGSSDLDGLRIRSYNSTTLAAISASSTVSTNPRAKYGTPYLDTTANRLLVPIQFADDSTYGADYVRVYDTSLVLQSTFETCRAPTEIHQDFEGASRYRYVFCPNSRLVNIYNLSNTLIDSLSAPIGFKRMVVHSDGSDRYVTMLGSAAALTIYESSVATNDFQATTVSLPSVMDDMGAMASVLAVATVNKDNNTVTIVDVVSESVSDTYYLPRSITSLIAQNRFVSHFTSAAVDSAYTLEELFNGSWNLRIFDVGDNPVQLLYRPGHLYSLNRGSDTVSAINLSSQSVSSISTQDQPVSMALDTTLNRLWTANYGGDSYTTIDITPGAEALVGHAALPFSPQKVLYQSGDDTIYFAGETGARTVDGSSATTVATQTLPGTFSDMAAIATGAWVTSISDISVSTLTRTTLTTTDLSASPHLLTSNGSTGVLGLMNTDQLRTSNPYTHTVDPFTRLFSSISNLFLIQNASRTLRMIPYSTIGSSLFSGITQQILLSPDRLASDSLGNVWLADSAALKLQRIDSNFQMEALSDLNLNRAISTQYYSAENKLYVLIRNLNAVMVWDIPNDRRRFYSVCQTPKEILLDTNNSQLFVLCSELNAISALGLDDNGDIQSHRILATDSRPFDMILDGPRDRLFVSNRSSDSVLMFDATDLNTAPTRFTTSDEPTALAVNASNGNVYVFHSGPDDRVMINGTSLAVTTSGISMNDFSEAEYNNTSGELFALSKSTGTLYYDTSSVTFPTANLDFYEAAPASDMAMSTGQAKVYVVFPTKDKVRIYDEDVGVTDVDVGSSPSHVLALDAANRTFVSNFEDDSITVLNTTTDAVITTISLAKGCGPRKIDSLQISGTNYIAVVCDLNDTIERVHATNYSLLTPLSVRISD